MLKTHLLEPEQQGERVIGVHSVAEIAAPQQEVEGASAWLTLVAGELNGKGEMSIRELVAFIEEKKRQSLFKNTNISHIIEQGLTTENILQTLGCQRLNISAGGYLIWFTYEKSKWGINFCHKPGK